ncbi:MAG TPA: CAP domain-containing protein, partial [Candidatus Paceibacterota bacterium]|nr:CAP domain-containing protein [Candidatus Paceibacterota bacterium]
MFVIVLAIVLIRPESRAYLQDRLLNNGTFARLEKLNLSFDKVRSDIKTTVENLPDPLISKKAAVSGNLTVSVIVTETNNQRKANGLSELGVNELLTRAAQMKLDDMFKNQYFEHESPDGKGPGEVAEAAGYRFLTVGENLALGSFADEKDLVQAWMDSPGHRANILGTQFTEIGIAAKKGMFKGEEVWIAVQEFGKPLSACP